MWTARLLLAAQLLVCRLATDAPTSESTTASWEASQTFAPASFEAGSFGSPPPSGTFLSGPSEPGSFRPGDSAPGAPSPRSSKPEPSISVPPSVMLRLGNFTIDSTKSFRVPQAPMPATSSPANLVPPSRSPGGVRPTPPTPGPRVVAVGPHHHHHDRFGPTFDDVPDDGNATRVTVQLGDDASLNCRISLLQDKTVSWVRRRGGGVPELLTVGAVTYAADSRVSVARRYPGNWRLLISDVRTHDEGTYECQISTYPPRVSRTRLHVNTPQVWVVDEAGAPLLEKYYEAESTLALVCRARDVDVPAALSWLHEGRALNADTTRGGISVRTEQVSNGADSMLRLARVNASDAGNYTCAVRGARPHTVAVHVLNEESLAELHAGAASTGAPVVISLVLSLSRTLEHWHQAASQPRATVALAALLAFSLALLVARTNSIFDHA